VATRSQCGAGQAICSAVALITVGSSADISSSSLRLGSDLGMTVAVGPRMIGWSAANCEPNAAGSKISSQFGWILALRTSTGSFCQRIRHFNKNMK
jgi:hypothetical protein